MYSSTQTGLPAGIALASQFSHSAALSCQGCDNRKGLVLAMPALPEKSTGGLNSLGWVADEQS